MSARSAIVPVASMPTVLRWLADINARTSVVDAEMARTLVSTVTTGAPAAAASSAIK